MHLTSRNAANHEEGDHSLCSQNSEGFSDILDGLELNVTSSASSLHLLLRFVFPVSGIDSRTGISITAGDLFDLPDDDNSEGGCLDAQHECSALMPTITARGLFSLTTHTHGISIDIH
jgi:hypothetical protein